jgi:hypothetical protein
MELLLGGIFVLASTVVAGMLSVVDDSFSNSTKKLIF